jgi:phosphopantothenoylcysteine synthetase/decarboxylase
VNDPRRGVVYVIACAAGPATDLATFVRLVQAAGWTVCVGTTPAGRAFVDADQLASMTGQPVRHDYAGRAGTWPPTDAIIIAPATLSTINKLAAGIADSWALSLLIECMGLDIPIVAAPNVNPALARHPRFRHNITELRSWGVSVLWDPSAPPPVWMAPWPTILDELHTRTQH